MTRILIADDHEVVRSGLRSILEAHDGWEVVAEAEDGKEAISQAVETKPDVAIIDYSLPLMNGVEATRQISARLPKYRNPDLHHARQRRADRRAAAGRARARFC